MRLTMDKSTQVKPVDILYAMFTMKERCWCGSELALDRPSREEVWVRREKREKKKEAVALEEIESVPLPPGLQTPPSVGHVSPIPRRIKSCLNLNCIL